MKIRDEADAILAAGKLGLNVGTVCSAFGIDHNVHGEFGELLADAIARKDVKAMREVYQTPEQKSGGSQGVGGDTCMVRRIACRCHRAQGCEGDAGGARKFPGRKSGGSQGDKGLGGNPLRYFFHTPPPAGVF